MLKHLSQSYSTSEDSDDSLKDPKKLNKIVKSEQKNKIVRNIFLNVSKTDGGAKGKGQVMIVDNSEDSQKPLTNMTREFSLGSNITDQDNQYPSPVPIICKIDLSRLSRIPEGLFSSNHKNTECCRPHTELDLLPKVKYDLF